MRRVWNQCVKELVQFRRDRLTVALAFFLPLITLLIYGFAIRLEIKNIPLTVRDLDNTPQSRSYIERIFATNQFVAVPWATVEPLCAPFLRDSGHPNRLDPVDRGSARAAVIIPPGFANDVKAGRTGQLQVIIDGTDVANARVIKNSLLATNRFFLETQGLLPQQTGIVPHTRLWFNPGRRESLYIVPGAFAIVLAIYPPLLAAIAMSREQEQGNILQVYASSLTATELLLGKSLAYLLVGIAEAVFIMTIGAIIWGLRFAGDPTPLLVGTPIFIFSSIQLGILIGTRTQTQSAAVQGVATVKFMTALLLSGFIFPLSNIPFPLSLISYVVPARYYLELVRDGFVRGTGWAGIWFVPVVLLLLAGVEFAITWWGIRQMQLSD
ncbi:ABC transporter permease [Fischerella sp. NIES-3754]|uniref:ABC transporter permease n=1 Tax=Fischerella sp. NIES-3754 TaxID=1752063 RepID=UPI000720E901|nr:ABC transporter permease [Fischerella sp. NIES-3754]BAU05757.1 ABC-2 type transporter [Fischerella sp. NIES-3754]BCX08030.1 MAG: ABC transporter permease [Fischerella sp.]